jgi:hypothetical protein
MEVHKLLITYKLIDFFSNNHALACLAIIMDVSSAFFSINESSIKSHTTDPNKTHAEIAC